MATLDNIQYKGTKYYIVQQKLDYANLEKKSLMYVPYPLSSGTIEKTPITFDKDGIVQFIFQDFRGYGYGHYATEVSVELESENEIINVGVTKYSYLYRVLQVRNNTIPMEIIVKKGDKLKISEYTLSSTSGSISDLSQQFFTNIIFIPFFNED
jgi:hypothetical protein